MARIRAAMNARFWTNLRYGGGAFGIGGMRQLVFIAMAEILFLHWALQ